MKRMESGTGSAAVSVQAVIYCRASEDRSGREISVHRQERDGRARAEALGWNVAEVLTDNDTSAYSGKPQPGYTALLEDLRAGRFGAVIVWREDRLYRRLPDLLPFLDAVRGAGAEVEVVKAGRWDLGTADGRNRVKHAALAAEYEAERMGERVRAGMEDAARDGRFHGGQRPYGYDKHGVTIVEDEADRVREAAGRLLAGESTVAVCRDWNARGVPAPRGGAWIAKTLQGILGNPRYAGLRVHRGEVMGAAG